MKRTIRSIAGLLVVGALLAGSLSFTKPARGEVVPIPQSPALEIRAAQVQYLEELELLVFEQRLGADVAAAVPQSAGQLDGAPVVGYVFPTTLSSADVGFGDVAGTVALAVTSHPDFDDTPLWDEDSDADYGNDGAIWHSHWVLLGADERVPAGLSVVEFDAEDQSVVMPPTNPGMAMYLDSPGFSVTSDGENLRVMVPAQRVGYHTRFSFDAVTAYMEVNTSDAARPTLGVYEVYDISSGDLSLPYRVRRELP